MSLPGFQEGDVEHRRQHHAEEPPVKKTPHWSARTIRHHPRQRSQVRRVRREDESAVRQVRRAMAADGRRDVARAFAHPVALVARPVGQRDVGDSAGARVGDESASRKKSTPAGKKVKAPRAGSYPIKTAGRGYPGRRGTKTIDSTRKRRGSR